MRRHDGSYMFFALEPNSRYEARVQAKNQHGWSKFSELFVFSTRATGTIQPPHQPAMVIINIKVK
jgi:hypothetical protein